MFDNAKAAQKFWAKTPLWRRAELLKKAAALMREHAAPMADCLIKEVAKPKKVCYCATVINKVVSIG